MNKSNSLPPDLQQTVIAAQQAQRQNPNAESFIVSHVDGLGWRLISAKTGKEYTQESYYKEFGFYPQLPHPEVFYSDEAMAERAKRKRPKPKGFGKQ
jgi:hypothetical protein